MRQFNSAKKNLLKKSMSDHKAFKLNPFSFQFRIEMYVYCVATMVWIFWWFNGANCCMQTTHRRSIPGPRRRWLKVNKTCIMYIYVKGSVLQYSTDFWFYYKQSWGPKNAHQVPAPRFSPPKIFLILVVRSKSWPASYLFFWHLQPWLNISNISTAPKWVS